MRSLVQSLCLVSMLTFASTSSHAIFLSFGKSEKSNESMEAILTSAYEMLDEAFVLSEKMSTESVASANETEGALKGVSRQAGRQFGIYLKRYFDEVSETGKFDAEKLDQVTYEFMVKANDLSYRSQRELMLGVHDQVKLVTFPGEPPEKAATPGTESRMARFNWWVKGGIIVLAAGYTYIDPITIDRYPVLAATLVTTAFGAREIGMGLGYVGKYLRMGLDSRRRGKWKTTIQEARVKSTKYLRSVTPRECSALLNNEIQEKQSRPRSEVAE